MDPDATLCRLIDAAHDRDVSEMLEAAEDLAGWLRAGGFAPNIIGVRRHWGDVPSGVHGHRPQSTA